jgi:hypothetical protein
MKEQYVLKESNFSGEHPLCSYIQAYLKASDLTIGDKWNAVDYMNWIDQKHNEFRKMFKLSDIGEYNEKEKQMFLKHISYVN